MKKMGYVLQNVVDYWADARKSAAYLTILEERKEEAIRQQKEEKEGKVLVAMKAKEHFGENLPIVEVKKNSVVIQCPKKTLLHLFYDKASDKFTYWGAHVGMCENLACHFYVLEDLFALILLVEEKDL